jgi:hypothetical protein
MRCPRPSFRHVLSASCARGTDVEHPSSGTHRCGVKDVAYLLGSCFDEDELERSVAPMLDLYFAELRGGSKGFDAEALDDVEGEWRGLWSWAVADFQRFLIGWAPGHWKLNGYGSRLASQVATQCADC